MDKKVHKDVGNVKYAIKKDKKGMVYVLNSNIESVTSVDELQSVFGTWIIIIICEYICE